MESRKTVASVVLMGVMTVFTGTAVYAQVSTQDAHNQGMSLGTNELSRVGTSNITQSNAEQLVPFYKDDPVQKNEGRTDSQMFFDMGVGRITSSRTYTAGNCDRESFNPEVEARKGIGEEKWARMTSEQRVEAINNQRTFFDQECEGINFLAGEYPSRTRYEIDPNDDLSTWVPGEGNPDLPGACGYETITTPAEYDIFTCNQSSAFEHRQCFEDPEIEVYYTDGLPEAPYTNTIYNSNSPRWTLTVYPAAGVVDVYAAESIYRTFGFAFGDNTIDTECALYVAANPGLTCKKVGSFFYEVHAVGPRTQRISLYGGMTTIQQTHFINERFRVRTRQRDSCVFHFDNYHYSGGSGAPDVHQTWTYNFCVPIKQVRVNWRNNCGYLEEAMNR